MLQKSDTNNAIITRLSNVRPHPNADRLKLATVLGTQVVVGLDANEDDLVIYFDSNLRLSPEYLYHNNLYSNKDMNQDTNAKGYFGKQGRVKAQRFRGEVSNGYVAEFKSLNFIGTETICGLDFEVILNEGDEFTHINGVKICEKYIIPTKHRQGSTRQRPKAQSDMFWRHWDTKQLMRESDKIVPGILYIEEKIHGTSGRTGKVLCTTGKKWYQFWKPEKEWKVLSGTRRIDNTDYHLSEERKAIEAKVAPHLHKGEQIYYEIYGHTCTGQQIQSGFNYGCVGGEYKCMLYRVTITTEDGYCIDLNREQVYKRAEELGLEKPTLLTTIHADLIKDFSCESLIGYAEGKSTVDANTLREGIVVWFKDKDGKWDCLKHKSEEYLMLESKQRDKEIGDCEDNL